MRVYTGVNKEDRVGNVEAGAQFILRNASVPITAAVHYLNSGT